MNFSKPFERVECLLISHSFFLSFFCLNLFLFYIFLFFKKLFLASQLLLLCISLSTTPYPLPLANNCSKSDPQF